MHRFVVNGERFVLDENTNSLHQVDQMVWDILGLDDLREEVVVAALGERYPMAELQQALEELQQLRQAGLLFTAPPEPVSTVSTEQPLVKALCLHLAHDCNLRCAYCFAGTGPFGGSRELMPLEVGQAALDFLVQSSGPRRNLEVDFFGGEPLLNFRVLQQLVDYGRSLGEQHNKNFRFTLTTNATLLTQEVQDYLNREQIAVVLSLDGRQEINDRTRPFVGGQGSYQTIVPDMLQFAASRGHENYYVRGTYTRYNLDFASDVAHMAELGFRHLSMEPVVGSPSESYTFKPEDLPHLQQEYERLAAYYVQRHREGKPFTFFHFNVSLEHGPCPVKRVTGCGAGYDYLAVTPAGELYPCHQFVGQKEWEMGTVFQGITRPDISRQFQEVNLYSKPDCVDCWARFFCSGGCMAHAWFANGDFTKPEPMACALQRKRLECALYAYAKTRK
ncbi:MAG: thioether cross-link-forming SCIFF peptide maturase [Bacillota bacterium]|jgi:uncharacterized protein